MDRHPQKIDAPLANNEIDPDPVESLASPPKQAAERPTSPGIALAGQSLTYTIRQRCLVDHLNLSVAPGEVVGLLGPNGAGKTTCFYLLCGLLAATEGTVFLGEQDVTQWPPHRRARAGLGYLHQEPSVFQGMTVAHNVLVTLELAGLLSSSLQVEQTLQTLGITHLADRRADRLSGGERRRLEIARCLALRPRVLLLDEPFAALDPRTVFELQDIIGSLAQQGLAVLITDHNVRETLQICSRAYILEAGCLLAAGTKQQVVENPRVQTAYLGKRFSLSV